MKCITLRHWQKILTLFLLVSPGSFAATDSSVGPYGLPNEIYIQVGNQTVKGFFGDPEALKEAAKDSPSELPPEGFVYRIERGPEPKIGIAVWSTTKKEAKILAAAENKITEIIYEYQTKKGEEPGGFLFDGLKGMKRQQQVAERRPAVPDMRPQLAGAELNPIAPVAAATGSLETNVTTPSGWAIHPYTYWFFVLLAVIVGVTWASRKKRA